MSSINQLELCCILRPAVECPYCAWKRCPSHMIGGLPYGSHWNQAKECPRRKELNTLPNYALIINSRALEKFYKEIRQ